LNRKVTLVEDIFNKWRGDSADIPGNCAFFTGNNWIPNDCAEEKRFACEKRVTQFDTTPVTGAGGCPV